LLLGQFLFKTIDSGTRMMLGYDWISRVYVAFRGVDSMQRQGDGETMRRGEQLDSPHATVAASQPNKVGQPVSVIVCRGQDSAT
jgi:hypothetical protein